MMYDVCSIYNRLVCGTLHCAQALVTLEAWTSRRVYDEFADEKFSALLHAQVLSDFSEFNRRLSRYILAYDQQEQALALRLLWSEENSLLVAQSRLRRAYVLCDIGCVVDAELSNDQARRIFRHRFHGDLHPSVAAACSLKCDIDIQNGKHASAKEMAQLAKKINEDVFFDYHSAVVHSVYLTGLALHASGQYRQTEGVFADAIYRAKKALGQYSMMSARSACAAAESHMISGNLREASTLFREALAIQERVIDTHHPHYIRTLTGLAMNLHYAGSYRDSIAYFNTAHTLLMERDELFIRDAGVGRQRSGQPSRQIDVPVRSMWMLARADLHTTMGEFDLAADLYQTAVESRKKMYGSATHPAVVEAILYEAENWRSRGQNTDKLGALYEDIVNNMLSTYGEDHPAVSRSRQARSEYLVAYEAPYQGDGKVLTKCRADLMDCCYIVGRCEGARSLRYASVCSCISMVLRRESQFDEAKKYLDDALRVEECCLGREHGIIADTVNRMAMLYMEQEQWEEAELYCIRSLEMYKVTFGLDHPKTINCNGNLGLVMISAEHTLTAGLRLITEALEALQAKKYTPQHPWIKKFLHGQDVVKRLVGCTGMEIGDDGENDTSSQQEGSLNSVEKDIVDMEFLLVEKENYIKTLEARNELLEMQYKSVCLDKSGDEPNEAGGRVKDREDSQANTAALEAQVELELTRLSRSQQRVKELEAKLDEDTTMTAALEVIVAEKSRTCDALTLEVKLAMEGAHSLRNSLQDKSLVEAQLRDRIKELEEAEVNATTSSSAATSVVSGGIGCGGVGESEKDEVYMLKEESVRLQRMHNSSTRGDKEPQLLPSIPMVETLVQSPPQSSQLVSQLTENIAHLRRELAACRLAQGESDDTVVELREYVARLKRLLSKCNCRNADGIGDTEILKQRDLDFCNLTEERDRLLAIHRDSLMAVDDLAGDLDGVCAVAAAAMKDVGCLTEKLNQAEAEVSVLRAEIDSYKAEFPKSVSSRSKPDLCAYKGAQSAARNDCIHGDMGCEFAVSATAIKYVEDLKIELEDSQADNDSLRTEVERLRTQYEELSARGPSADHRTLLDELEMKLRRTEDRASQLASELWQVQATSEAAQAVSMPLSAGMEGIDGDVVGKLAVSAADVEGLKVALKEMQAENNRLRSEVEAANDWQLSKLSPEGEKAINSGAIGDLRNSLKQTEAEIPQMKVASDQLLDALGSSATELSDSPELLALATELANLKALLRDREEEARRMAEDADVVRLDAANLQEQYGEAQRELEAMRTTAERIVQDEAKSAELVQQLDVTRSAKATLERELLVSTQEVIRLEKAIGALTALQTSFDEERATAHTTVTALKDQLAAAERNAAESRELLTHLIGTFDATPQEKNASLLSVVPESVLPAISVKCNETIENWKSAKERLHCVEMELLKAERERKDAVTNAGELEVKVASLTHDLVVLMEEHSLCGQVIADLEAQAQADRNLQQQYIGAKASVLDDVNRLQKECVEAKNLIVTLQAESQEFHVKLLERDELRSRMTTIDSELKGKISELEDVYNQLKCLTDEIAETTADNKDKRAKIELLNRMVDELQAENRALAKNLESSEAVVKVLQDDHSVLSERMHELQEIQQELKSKLEFAKSQKQVHDPWGFSKEAELGFRRFKVDCRPKCVDGTDPVSIRKITSAVRRLSSQGNHSGCENDSVGADVESVELSKNVDELLRGCVQSRNFAAAKGVMGPSNAESSLPDIRRRPTVVDYIAATASLPSIAPLSARTWSTAQSDEPSTPAVRASTSPVYSGHGRAGSYCDDDDNYKLLFARSPCNEAPIGENQGPQTFHRNMKSNETAATKNDVAAPNFRKFSSTAPARQALSVDEASHREQPKSERRQRRYPTKNSTASAKLKVRRAVYGCIDTERDLHVSSKHRQFSGHTATGTYASDKVLQKKSASLESAPTDIDFCLSQGSLKRLPSKLLRDSRFLKSIPPTVPNMWSDDNGSDCDDCDDGLTFGSSSGVDQDSVTSTLRRKELGLY